MRGYIIRRLLLFIPTLLLVSLLVFLLVRLIPGDIVDIMAAESSWHADITRESIEKALGLDQPVHIQYGRWMGFVRNADGNFSGILQGNLGTSLWAPIPVLDKILVTLPITLELGILAIIVTVVGAIPLGIYSAIRQDTVGDYTGRSLATILICLPNFWVAVMVVLFASIWFNVSPPLKPTLFITNPLQSLKEFIVPAVILGMAAIGGTARLLRSMMLEVLRQDYIRTAWAKGLRERVVVSRHALKNALIPVVIGFGLQLRAVMGGAVIIETIFSLPGLGRLVVDATNERDYPVVTGAIFAFALFLMLINLAIDLTYAYLDPRIHYK